MSFHYFFAKYFQNLFEAGKIVRGGLKIVRGGPKLFEADPKIGPSGQNFARTGVEREELAPNQRNITTKGFPLGRAAERPGHNRKKPLVVHIFR
ncbi:MAG: hypothetical protein GY755_21675 [Chloroflexi bacterium]|nr:hypothetical protein [Chloroflexota bacterium]